MKPVNFEDRLTRPALSKLFLHIAEKDPTWSETLCALSDRFGPLGLSSPTGVHGIRWVEHGQGSKPDSDGVRPEPLSEILRFGSEEANRRRVARRRASRSGRK